MLVVHLLKLLLRVVRFVVVFVACDFLASSVELLQVALVQIIDRVPADFLEESPAVFAAREPVPEVSQHEPREVLCTSELVHYRKHGFNLAILLAALFVQPFANQDVPKQLPELDFEVL